MKKRLLSLALLIPLSGCLVNTDKPQSADDKKKEELGRLFGNETFTTVTGGGKKESLRGTGVNVYLWRASLDTLSSLPTKSVDPFAGFIETDWYSHPDDTNTRIKVNISITDEELRCDGLRVAVFQQEKKNSQWVTIGTSEKISQEIEIAILTRARQLKKKKAKIG